MSGGAIVAIIFVVFFVIVILIALVNYESPGIHKAHELGNVIGKHLQDITPIVGNPNSLSYSGTNRLLIQWMGQGGHLAMLFEYTGQGEIPNVLEHQADFVGLGITHQSGQ